MVWGSFLGKGYEPSCRDVYNAVLLSYVLVMHTATQDEGGGCLKSEASFGLGLLGVPLLEGGFSPCLGVQSCSVTWLVLQPLSSCHSSAGALPAAAGGLQTCPTKLHLLPNYNRSGAPPGTPRAASF